MPQQTNKQSERLLGALGLCARARALIFGTAMICEALRAKTPPFMVLEALDTSDGTHKRLSDKCSYYQTPHVRLAVTAEQLAHAVGKSATLAAVAVTNENFARLIETQLREE